MRSLARIRIQFTRSSGKLLMMIFEEIIRLGIINCVVPRCWWQTARQEAAAAFVCRYLHGVVFRCQWFASKDDYYFRRKFGKVWKNDHLHYLTGSSSIFSLYWSIHNFSQVDQLIWFLRAPLLCGRGVWLAKNGQRSHFCSKMRYN